MTELAPVVFLLDVDNTLLDNDRVTADLKQQLTHAFGAQRQERYWAIFEERRRELGYSDYAHDPKAVATYPAADIAIERIGDLLRYDLPALLVAG